MLYELTTAAVHAMMPHCPMNYVQALVDGQKALSDAGILSTANRTAYLFANVAEESGEFHEITENIHYSPARACAVWPSRFHSAGDVYAKINSWPGDPAFSQKLMDNVYGGRMGNVPGTHDGSMFIGRGPLQLTGKSEYGEMGKATGLDLVNQPELANEPANWDPIMAAYVKIRGLNFIADRADFTNYVRRINGGTIGMTTRLYWLHHMQPIVAALADGTIGPDHSIYSMQRSLNTLQNAGLVVDGKAGPETTAAVVKFQKANSLQADGIPGRMTWEAIDNQMRPAA